MLFVSESRYSPPEYATLVSLIESRDGQCTESDKNPDGTWATGNDCGSKSGGADTVSAVAKKAKERNVDVMLGGGHRVAVMDEEARQRALKDTRDNPKPEGSAAGSATDVWSRTFVTRAKGRVQKPKDGSPPRVSDGKIASTDPVFTPDDLRQSGQFTAHEAVGSYLANRHEEARRSLGVEGPAAIIDTASSDMPEPQIQYIVDAITEDALHAYDVLGVDPGFYSTDLEETMRQMTERHPEFADDDNARFVFTTLLAITSSGQGPDANLRDADDLYRMFKEHGTVVPTNYGGGARDVTSSLKVFQGLIDSFGPDRTRRLLSGYTTAGNVDKALRKLAEKSNVDEWSERTGSSPWSVPVDSKGKKKDLTDGELRDEVVPVAAIFGPKIGAFFANLSGRHDFLTMDRWLMRSVGRVTGELITRSTPEAAKKRAAAAIASLESRVWKKEFLFGVDKTHGISKADVIRSLKIQQKTGVIEENGAAFIWATAAERAHQKVRRPSGGGYGTHPDPAIAAMHAAGNSLFKSLILEQQDPKSPTARRNIREVFRRVQSEIERRTGRKADIDEIQAALWQYEKRLWKHLGAKTNITDNSLFSAAAEGVVSGRLKRDKPFTPASRRDYAEIVEEDEDEFDTNPFDAEQSAWDSNFADLGIDLFDLLRLLEEDFEEQRNFAALDVEYRSADCGREESGEFAPKNQCQGEGSGAETTSGKNPTASQKKNKEAVEKAKAISGPIKADDPRIEGFRKPFRPTASPNSDFVSIPDDAAVKAALSSDKQDKFGKSRALEEGRPVDLRIDIPTFERKGVYAVTVHEHTGTSRIGSPIGYDSVVRLSGDVSFSADNEQLATSIMFGRDKTPLATVKGKFSKSREIPLDIDSWTPVGYDPKKATFFYDKKTGQEVLGGTDAISIGNSVFVRSPKRGRRNAATDYRSSDGFWIPESRSADCGRDDGGKFDGGNTCAGTSNSKGESFRGVRRKGDKTQTKVARKLYQMRLSEGKLKDMVRGLGGKVSNTLVEIDTTRGDEGVNIFVRDRDNNESHVIHVGYYGATVFNSDTLTAGEVSRIQEVVKSAMPNKIDDRLWARGTDYPVQVVNDPKTMAEQFGRITAKQRLKKERRSCDSSDKNSDGTFGPGNDCGGGTATAKSDESWKSSSRDKSWDSRRLQKSPPIKGGEKMQSVKFEGPKHIAQTMSEIMPSRATIDDVATIGGGAVRGGQLTVSSEKNSGEIKVELVMPVSPDKPDDWRVYSSVSLLEDAGGGFFVNYDLLDVWPPGDEEESLMNTDTLDEAMTSRVSSIMMERMIESMMAAEKLGATAAETVAVGAGGEYDKFKGYRLWPQFGFDGEINRRTKDLIEDDIDSVGLSDEARAKWDAGEALTVQDIIATREGRRWWDEWGSSTPMGIDFSKKRSPGYLQYQKMQRLLPRLKERNKSRSWIEDFESRNCGRVSDGTFAPGNDCQAPDKDGTQTIGTPTQVDDSWREQTGSVSWGEGDKPPLRNAPNIKSLTIDDAGGLASAMDFVGIESLDELVALGGGRARGASVDLSPSDWLMLSDGDGETITITVRTPIDKDAKPSSPGVDRGNTVSARVSVTREPSGDRTMHYASLETPLSVSSANPNKQDRLRIASILKEQMLESLSAAESSGITKVTTTAAGDAGDMFVQGYRLWPQFGFDGEVKDISKIPDEIVLKAAGIDIPPAGATRIPQATVIRSLRARVKKLTIQQLISTREGERWWDENGDQISLSLDLADKSSPGYKRLQEAKKQLPRLKDRNKSRDWLDWLEELETREADCGRDEGGRFGPKNQCQEEGGGSFFSRLVGKLRGKQEIDAPKERPRISRGDAESRLKAAGVELRVDASGDVSPDAYAAAADGVEALLSYGLPAPAAVVIGRVREPGALAQYDPESDTITISSEIKQADVLAAFKRKWLVDGGSSSPFATLMAHEVSHHDHFAKAGAQRWREWSGAAGVAALKAASGGRTSVLTNDDISDMAWSPDHRASASPVSVSAARKIARQVSNYAATNPLEFVAEFRTGVLAGYEYSDEAWQLYEAYDGPPVPRKRKK